MRRGAKEINLAVNYGKMISRQFQYVETEIQQMSESCHAADALLTVVFDSQFLTEDLKVILCKMCKRTETHFLQTNAAADFPLLKQICKDMVRIKAFAAPGSLADFQAAYAAGCDRYSTPTVLRPPEVTAALSETPSSH